MRKLRYITRLLLVTGLIACNAVPLAAYASAFSPTWFICNDAYVIYECNGCQGKIREGQAGWSANCTPGGDNKMFGTTVTNEFGQRCHWLEVWKHCCTGAILSYHGMFHNMLLGDCMNPCGS